MNAAVLWDVDGDWTVEEVDLDPPQEGEVLVSFEATGLCHSDHHPRTGDIPAPLPIIGGHEGAGIVQEVGPGVRGLQARRPRRRVVPARVRPVPVVRDRSSEPVRSGRDHPERAPSSTAPTDGTSATRTSASSLLLGTFAQYGTVSEASLVKIDDDMPLSRACLLGCGVTTGWGRRSTPPTSGPATPSW